MSKDDSMGEARRARKKALIELIAVPVTLMKKTGFLGFERNPRRASGQSES